MAVVCFLLFASVFLYYFVDDEAIPFVYAQNILHHKGLTYSAFEGHVEGYSDFLHVWLATALLALTRVLGVAKWNVFFIGKAISLTAGVMILVLVDRLLRASRDIDAYGRFVGLMFLALAGPLAVWSCSSLETVTFAAMITLLLCALAAFLADAEVESRWAVRLACAMSIVAPLERIDGFIHVGVLVGAALIIASAAQRRVLLRRVVLPAAVVFVAYHSGRRWYFGEWLPGPLVAKILYKLQVTGVVVTKPPEERYIVGFLAAVGWLVPIGVPVLILWLRRERRVLALLAATLAMCTYAGFVGDWMFGFRMFVPTLPWLAILVAAAVSALLSRWSIGRIGRVSIAAALVIWFAVSAVRFVRIYQREEEREVWLLHPTAPVSAYFMPVYTLYDIAKPYVKPGTPIAFNQAGFVPFMLDADNLDDLGVCSRFIAHLPTSDDVHTEVGRYAPLTNRPSIRAAHAYLLYREPVLLVARGDLIRHANFDHAPQFLLDFHYRALAYDDVGDNVVYIRTDVPTQAFRLEPRRFLENLVHVSSLRHAFGPGGTVPPAAYLQQFPYLYDGVGHVTFRHGDRLDLTFGPPETDVYELHAESIVANADVTMLLQLRTTDGKITFHEEMPLTAHKPAQLHIYLPDATPAARFTLQALTDSADPVTLRLTDLRVQGQRPALADYVRRTLQFPLAAMTQSQ